MRHIALLDSSKVPRDDEFSFRERAGALVNKWHDIITDIPPFNSVQYDPEMDNWVIIDKKEAEPEVESGKVVETISPGFLPSTTGE